MAKNSRETWFSDQKFPPIPVTPDSMGQSIPGMERDNQQGYGSERTDQQLSNTLRYPNVSPETHPTISALAGQEPLLTGAILVSALIMIYQIGVIITNPTWAPVATDWVRAGLSWVQLLPVLLASLFLYRHHQSGRLSWLMFAAAMASYALAQTTWALLNQIIMPNNVPVPSLADLFYLGQYPFFFLGLALLPGLIQANQLGITRAKIVIDSLLLMAAGTALSWYFLLAPFYLQSGQSVLGKITNMSYPVGDLGLLFGLTVVLISPTRQMVGRRALSLFIPAIIFLIIADSLFLTEELYPTFDAANLAAGCWMACYLLFALAGLFRLREGQREQMRERGEIYQAGETQGPHVQFEAKNAWGVRSLIPFLAAVVASTLIVFRAATAPYVAVGGKNLIVPFLIGLGLLALVAARQSITVLENERLFHSEQRRAKELDQAKRQGEEQRMLLDEGIRHLSEVLVEAANGNKSVRVQMNKDNLLWRMGYSINLVLVRLMRIGKMEQENRQLRAEVNRLTEALYFYTEKKKK